MIFERNELRKSYRVKLLAYALIEEKRYRVSDWSFEGFGIHKEASDAFKPGKTYPVTFTLPFQNFDFTFKARAVCRWASKEKAGFKFVNLPDDVKAVMKNYLKAYIEGKLKEVGDLITFVQPGDIPPSLEEPLTPQEEAALDRKLKRAVLFYGVVALSLLVLIYLVIRESHSLLSAEAFWAGSVATVMAPREGVVRDIFVREGEEVRPGTPLCSIVNLEVEEKAQELEALIEVKAQEVEKTRKLIEEARASLSPQAKRELIKAEMERIKRLLRRAREKLRRFRKLYQQGYLPRGRLEDAQKEVWNLEGELKEAKIRLSNLKGDEAQLVKLKMALQGQEAELKKLQIKYQQFLEKSQALTLKATTRGRVRSVYKLPGEQVKTYEPIMALEVPNRGYVIARYKFRDAEYISIGDEAEVYIPALNVAVPGKVVAVGKVSLFSGNKLQESEEYALRDLPVKVALAKIPPGLSYGMRVEVKLRVRHFRPYVFRYFARLFK